MDQSRHLRHAWEAFACQYSRPFYKSRKIPEVKVNMVTIPRCWYGGRASHSIRCGHERCRTASTPGLMPRLDIMTELLYTRANLPASRG